MSQIITVPYKITFKKGLPDLTRDSFKAVFTVVKTFDQDVIVKSRVSDKVLRELIVSELGLELRDVIVMPVGVNRPFFMA